MQVNNSVSEGYEPYFVVRKDATLPRYDERFEGYGKNKISWVVCLRCMGYRFRVLKGAFLVHGPHVSQKQKAAHQGDGTAAAFKLAVQNSKERFGHYMDEMQCPKQYRPLPPTPRAAPKREKTKGKAKQKGHVVAK